MSREQFEQRMRARRAATCLAVARTAIANGRILDAIDRLEEACELDPDPSEARLLLDELRSQERENPAGARPAPPTRFAGWSHWLAAGVAIGALAGLAFFWPAARPVVKEQTPPPARLATPGSGDSPAPPADGDRTRPSGASASLEFRDPVGTSGQAAPGPAAAPDDTRRGVSVQLKPQPVVAETLPIVAPSPPAQAPPSEPASEGSSAANAANPPTSASALRPAGGEESLAAPVRQAVQSGQPVPTLSSPPAPQAAALPPLDRATLTAEEPKMTSEAVAAVPLMPPPGRSVDAEEASLSLQASQAGEIEQTLHRYADAYARLDARAARAVWPTVDQRALARAFEGLESQGLMFDHCDVTVTGGDATAACRGRARYVPKVGSRAPLLESRQWTFRLRKADAGWQIVQADAR